jgi:hypothetical protein
MISDGRAERAELESDPVKLDRGIEDLDLDSHFPFAVGGLSESANSRVRARRFVLLEFPV